MLVDESEEADSALEDVGFASELRFVESLLLEAPLPLLLETLSALLLERLSPLSLETLSVLLLETLLPLPALLDVVTSSSALLEDESSISSALLEDVISISSALLPLSPQAAIMAAMLNVAKSENFFILKI